MRFRNSYQKDLEQQISQLIKLTVRQAERIRELENENDELDRKRKAWLRTAAAYARQLRENTDETHHGKLDRPRSVQRKNGSVLP